MNIADRLQILRKSKDLSQEALADKLGVSRQAVSKWESAQSTPDLDKIIAISAYFHVTTDYLLTGTAPVKDSPHKEMELAGKILYIASTSFIMIGLFCAFGGWYEDQTMGSIWGSMIIQVVGLACYFIGKMLSDARPGIAINWLNCAGVLFMPYAMLSGVLSLAIFHEGWIAPYPIVPCHVAIFVILYGAALGIIGILLKKNQK